MVVACSGNEAGGEDGLVGGDGATAAAVLRRNTGNRLHRLGLVLTAGVLGFLCLVAVRNWIAGQNEGHYGEAVTTELSEPQFRRAFHVVTELDARRNNPYKPITREAMAARVSVRFGELMPFLAEQFDGAGWSKFGCEWMDICTEIAGGWMGWELREAAGAARKHADAVSARAFLWRNGG